MSKAIKEEDPQVEDKPLSPEAEVDVEEEYHDDDDDDYDKSLNDDDDVKPARKRKRDVKVDDDDEGDDEEVDDVEEDDGDKDDDPDVEAKPQKPKRAPKPKPKKRGRKKTKFILTDQGFLDEDGNPIAVEADEVVIDDEDPKGQAKIDKNGFLQGGRRFRMKTFTLLGHGEQQFMVSTEPARLVGFRDSYLLFKTHKSLFKKVCTHEEKMDLIDRHIIPNSYKGRAVNLVAARSIYREFGAKVIVDGKKVIDDFWEQKAIDNGDVAGEYADPLEYQRTQLKLNGVGGDAAGSTPPVAGTALINYQNDPTWMHQVVVDTKKYNDKLLELRNQVWARGLKDTYSGFSHYPISSQPTTSKIQKVGPALDIVVTTVFTNPNIRRKVTGLASVPKEIFEDLDDDIKKAILDQQQYEKSVL